MASEHQINIVEVTRVSPPAESATEFTLPLTFLDTFWFKFPPVERLFFYKLPESTRPLFSSVINPKLKASLSVALSLYLPLAGNLTWPPSDSKPTFFYTPGDGVPLTVAESTADFDRLAGRGIKSAAELHPLVPKLDCSDEKAEPVSLQITLFPDRGFCVGVSAHHAALDGKSMTSFMKAWAYLCREGEAKKLPPELVPFLDRSVVKDPTRIDQLYAEQWVNLLSPNPDDPRRTMTVMSTFLGLPPDLVRATFELTKEDIEQLRRKVSSPKRRRPSTFIVTLAYMMTSMIRARGGSGDRGVGFGFAADYRARLDPPVPENYFGNCVCAVFGKEAQAKHFMDEDGFEFAGEIVSESVERLESDPMADLDKKLTTLFGYMKNPDPAGEPLQTFSVAGAPRFGVYGVDFGWGRPELVEIVSVDRSGAVALAESRDGGGGVEVGLVMKKDEMERLVKVFVDVLKP